MIDVMPNGWTIDLMHSIRKFRMANPFYQFGFKKCSEDCPMMRNAKTNPICITNHCIEMYPAYTDEGNDLENCK